MSRFLVIFRSHAVGLADEHFVSVEASSGLAAIRSAQRECPPMHGWAIARAETWPSGCRTLDAAARRMTGTR